jgi:hypothetical protein
MPFGGGSGTAVNPFLICSITHLQNVSNHLQKHFKLKKSLDLSGIEFSPIGNDSTGLSGTFDGDQKTISGWTYQVLMPGSDSSAIGFFRKIANGGKIKKLILNAFNVEGNSANSVVGSLAGYSNGSVEDVIIQNSSVSGYETVGGLIGVAEGSASVIRTVVKSSQILNPRPVCPNDSSIGGIFGVWNSSEAIDGVQSENVTVVFSPTSNFFSYAGGIVGRLWNGTLTNSFSSGSITGFRSVGGIAGDSSATISDTTTTMNVTGDSWIGGAVGVLSGTLARVSSSGDVFGNVPGTRVGGLVGTATSSSTMSRVFHDGIVLGDSSVGGLIGILSGGILTNGYVVGRVNGGSSNVGGAIGLLDDFSSLVNLIYVDEDAISADAGVIPQALVGGIANGASSPVQSYYINRIPGISETNGGVLVDPALLGVQGSYPGFDFFGVWKIPLVHPRGVLSPVFAWECGQNGVTCP